MLRVESVRFFCTRKRERSGHQMCRFRTYVYASIGCSILRFEIIYTWLLQQRQECISVSTQIIDGNAINSSINESFFFLSLSAGPSTLLLSRAGARSPNLYNVLLYTRVISLYYAIENIKTILTLEIIISFTQCLRD